MVTIRIPALWRADAGGPEVKVEADNVGAALRALGTRCPHLARQILDSQGQVNPNLNLFVNREAIRYHGELSAPLTDGDEIYIVPMLSGG